MLCAVSSSSGLPAKLSLSPRDIPPLQTAMTELLGIANNPDVSFDRLESVISRDQALTLRILTVANSSYYGCSRRVESVRTAVALLGTRQVQNIASAMALAPAFDSAHGPALWAHGLATALWTGHVMHVLGAPAIDYLFTAGLLHDIGVVLLLRNAADDEHACLQQAQDGEQDLSELERTRFGVDHAELGSNACIAWKLPQRIAKLVATHHDPGEPVAGEAVDSSILCLAETLAARCGHPEVTGQAPPDWPEYALAALGISLAEAETLEENRDQVEAEASAFG